MHNSHFHAVIWIDHHEARIFHFDRKSVETEALTPDNKMHVHHKANTVGSGHDTLDQNFLHDVILAVAEAHSILIIGPGNAKTELLKHIEHHDPLLREKIRAVETVDHPSDPEIVAYGRKFFKASDPMQLQ